MKEAEYIELIKSRWPSRNDSEPTPETITLCNRALAEYPTVIASGSCAGI
jgi:hypothetical protein